MPPAANYQYYAIKPFVKTLVSTNEIAIRQYITGEGLKGTSTVTLTNIQVESLAEACLEALGQVDIASIPFNEDEKAADDPVNDDIVKLSEAKKKIIAAIINSVAPLFQYIPNAVQLQAAKDALQQQLQRGLQMGWQVKNILVSGITDEAIMYCPGTPIKNSEGEEIDATDIPVVFRSFPGPVKIETPTFAPAFPDSAEPAEMQQWNYTIQFTLDKLQEDILYITPSFTSIGRVPEQSPLVDNALLNSLAEFTFLSRSILNDLLPLPAKITTLTANKRIALAAFAELAETVANAWANYWSDPIITGEQQQAPADAWALRQYNNNGQKGLLLSLPPGSSTAYNGWPVMMAVDNNEAMATTMLSDNECLYHCDPAITAVRLQLQYIPLFTHSVAYVGIATQRNRFGGSTIAADPGFTFPASAFNWPPGETMPLLEYNNAINIGDTNALLNFFDALLGHTEAVLTINLNYQYELAPGLPATLPVTLLPPIPWKERPIASMLSAATAWLQHQQPAKGVFVMDTAISKEERELMKISEIQFEME